MTTSPQQLRELAFRHFQQGNLPAAEGMYRQALAAADNPDAMRMLAWVVALQGRFDEALAIYGHLLDRQPHDAVAWLQTGNVLLHQGKTQKAIEAYRHSAQAKPDYADAYYNLGQALRAAGELDETVSVLRRAVELKPNYAEAWSNLGSALKDVGLLTEAIECYRRSLSIRPDPRVGSNLLYAMQFHPDYDAKQILAEHRAWNQTYAEPLRSSVVAIDHRRQKRRLRLGYVSPDFGNHPVGRSMIPVLEQADREQFEIFCYSGVRAPDAVTQRLQARAQVWRDVSALSDDQLAQVIRGDRIDILVDLAMHMGGNRLLAFALKPAPVQAAWQAYPGTTGLWAMDYRLTDPWLDPPGETDLNYSEKSTRLSDSFWCFQPLSEEPGANGLPAMSAGFVTFGCLNNFCKVNDAVLRLWAKALLAVHESRLQMLAPTGSARQRVLATLEANGVQADRVEFVAHQRPLDYLRTYHRIDIGLDTFPYNGHMTSLDSIWMGVPVVTRIGSTVVGRAGWSQLSNLGLIELAARDDEQFVKIATDLAADLARLAELRSTLRDRMKASPLMDAKRYARAAETAYLQMWDAWQKQECRS